MFCSCRCSRCNHKPRKLHSKYEIRTFVLVPNRFSKRIFPKFLSTYFLALRRQIKILRQVESIPLFGFGFQSLIYYSMNFDSLFRKKKWLNDSTLQMHFSKSLRALEKKESEKWPEKKRSQRGENVNANYMSRQRRHHSCSSIYSEHNSYTNWCLCLCLSRKKISSSRYFFHLQHSCSLFMLLILFNFLLCSLHRVCL